MNASLIISSTKPTDGSVNRLRVLASILGFTMFGVVACGDTPDSASSSLHAVQELSHPAQPPPTVGDEDASANPPSASLAATPKRAVKTDQVTVTATEKTSPKVSPSKGPMKTEARIPRAPTKKDPKPTVTSLQKYSVEGDFGVIEGGLATGVERRTPTGIGTEFSTATERIWAFIKVRNRVGPTHVKMVWKKNGKKRWSYDLRVGKSRGWRTWSRKKVGRRDVGSWSVDVLDAEGKVLVTMPFTISAAQPSPQA